MRTKSKHQAAWRSSGRDTSRTDPFSKEEKTALFCVLMRIADGLDGTLVSDAQKGRRRKDKAANKSSGAIADGKDRLIVKAYRAAVSKSDARFPVPFAQTESTNQADKKSKQKPEGAQDAAETTSQLDVLDSVMKTASGSHDASLQLLETIARYLFSAGGSRGFIEMVGGEPYVGPFAYALITVDDASGVWNDSFIGSRRNWADAARRVDKTIDDLEKVVDRCGAFPLLLGVYPDYGKDAREIEDLLHRLKGAIKKVRGRLPGGKLPPAGHQPMWMHLSDFQWAAEELHAPPPGTELSPVEPPERPNQHGHI